MKLQLLVSAVNEDVSTLAQRMNLESDAIIINQTDHFDYTEYEHKGKKIQCYSFAEKGVGLSRNNALLRAEGDIVLFFDEDIVYDSGYEEKILKAFEHIEKKKEMTEFMRSFSRKNKENKRLSVLN